MPVPVMRMNLLQIYGDLCPCPIKAYFIAYSVSYFIHTNILGYVARFAVSA